MGVIWYKEHTILTNQLFIFFSLPKFSQTNKEMNRILFFLSIMRAIPPHPQFQLFCSMM